jgi:hypothetical protein
MNLQVSDNKGERVWGCSKHAIEQFLERDKFVKTYRQAIMTMLKMIDKAVFITYDLQQGSDIYYHKNWVFVCKESTIVTIYQKQGCKWEHLIND